MALLLLPFAAACDQSFEPLAEHERHFSIFGVLNPAADTQWIRVTPVRDVLTTSALPGPIDAIVTLEDLGTGQTVTLSDSLFAYGVHNLDHSQHRYAYNFSTPLPIRAGATYRLTATRSDGATSSAMVPVAREYPRIVVGLGQHPNKLAFPDYVRLEGVDHLAMVFVFHYVPDYCLFYSNPHVVYQTLVTATSPAEGVHVVRLDRRPIQPPSPFRCTPELKKEISIITSGSEWAYSAELNDEVVTLPDAASNVTNGVGFLGGVLTKQILYERCTLIGAALTDFCELTYDADSATIEGVVSPRYNRKLWIEDLRG